MLFLVSILVIRVILPWVLSGPYHAVRRPVWRLSSVSLAGVRSTLVYESYMLGVSQVTTCSSCIALIIMKLGDLILDV